MKTSSQFLLKLDRKPSMEVDIASGFTGEGSRSNQKDFKDHLFSQSIWSGLEANCCNGNFSAGRQMAFKRENASVRDG